jgi:tetratricopeptide (TPR) repeat protein
MQGAILRSPLLHIFLIAILGLLIYSNTFNASFHFDDIRLIVDNPFIKDFSYFAEPSRADSVRYLEGRDTLRYFKTRYVGFLTLWANYSLHGLQLGGYHSINLILHIINAALVYFLVMLAFRSPLLSGSSLEENSWLTGLFAGLLFVAHPLQTEGVTYILSRFVLLVAMFYLLTLVLYVKARQKSMEAEQQEKKSFATLLLYCSSVLCCLLAMKTKENAFTLPVAILLFEVIFFRGRVKKRAVYLVPYLITMFIIPLTYMGLNAGEGGVASALEGSTKLGGAPPRLDYFLTQLRVIVGYIGLLLFPVGQNVDHNQQVYQSFFTPPVFLSFLFLLSIFCFGVYLLCRSRIADPVLRLVAFGIFWFFLALSVESSVLPIGEIMVEYRVYLPSAGFYIAVAAGIFLLISKIRNKAPVYASIVLVLLVLASATYARNTVWKSDITLWEDVVEKSPEKSRPYNNLGINYLVKYGIQNAVEQYKEALKFEPGNVEANLNIGSIYLAQGMAEDAIEYFKGAAESNPRFPDPHVFLGKAYLEVDEIKEAEEHFQRALKLMPDNAALYRDIGNAYVEADHADKALKHFSAALELNPDDSLTHNNIGTAYQSKGMLDKAIEHYRTAAELEPRNPVSYYNLGIIYQSRGLVDNAIQLYLIALKVNPKYAGVHNNLGVAYRSKGMLDKAIEHYRTAIELMPDYAQAHYNLGLVYFQQGLKNEARGEFEAALRIDQGYSKARESLEELDKKE